jgi:hypothetical protein
LRRRNQAAGQQADIESQLAGASVDGFLLRSKQIEEQRGQPSIVKGPGNEAIARAVTAAAAAMCEQHQTRRHLRQSQKGRCGNSLSELNRDLVCVVCG